MTNLDQIELLLNENQRLKDELREAASAVQTLTVELEKRRTGYFQLLDRIDELEKEVADKVRIIRSFT